MATGALGLTGEERGVRAVGLADLLLVPGLASGRNQAAWMTGRAALSLMQATYVDGVAAHSDRRGPGRIAAGVLLGLAAMDTVTALRLHRREA